MTMKDLMKQYFMGELDAISLIRMLSGMFDPKNATTLLTLICTITRHEQGDIDTDTFNSVWKFGIDLQFNNGDYPHEYDTMDLKELQSELESTIIALKDKQEIRHNTVGPIADEDGISIEADITGLDHDVSLLTTYITYRIKKDAEKEINEEDADESNGKTESDLV